MKKILFAGAGKIQNEAILYSRSLNIEPYSIDASEFAPGFINSMGHETGDIGDAKFVAACAKKFQVDGIVAVATDISVPSVAIACQQLSLPGLSIEAAKISVNKYLQRKCFQSAGIRVPKYILCSDASSVEAAIQVIGFPVVIKPCDASGSRGVSYLDNSIGVKDAAHFALSNSKTATALVEEYIDGPEYAVDGFILGNEIKILSISEKTRSTPPYLLDLAVFFPANLTTVESCELVHLTERALKAVKIQNSPFHIEIIRNKNGPLIVELAARGAGFSVFTKILPAITSVDVIKTQLDLCLGIAPKIKLPERNKGAAIIFISPLIGTLKEIHGLKAARDVTGVQEIEVYIEPGNLMDGLRCGADRIGHIITYGRDRGLAEMYAREAQSKILIEVTK